MVGMKIAVIGSCKKVFRTIKKLKWHRAVNLAVALVLVIITSLSGYSVQVTPSGVKVVPQTAQAAGLPP